MYAIVKTGGKQYKVAVGDVVEVEKLDGGPGATVQLPALLVVDGSSVTSDASELAGIPVTGEVVAQTKGPKLRILKFKNKTGYKKRQGHRQSLTQVRVTAIGDRTAAASASSSAADASASSGSGSSSAPGPADDPAASTPLVAAPAQ